MPRDSGRRAALTEHGSILSPVTLVTAHQPNYLPGLSVTEKARQADAVIWLDGVQYSRGGFTNRNRMPDGSWLTVPVQRDTLAGPISGVKIDYTRDWQTKHTRTLRQHYGAAANTIVQEIEEGYARLEVLNLACLRKLICPHAHWFVQSRLPVCLAWPISDQLAAMVERVGGDVYLSGPSGRTYLNEVPFHQRNIAVRYFDWPGANPCSMGTL